MGPSSKVNAILGDSSTGSPAVVSVEKFSEAVAFADACFTRESIPGPASEVRNCVRLSAEEKSRKKSCIIFQKILKSASCKDTPHKNISLIQEHRV